MFGRKSPPSEAVDVNDYIVSDSMQSGVNISADLGSSVPRVDIRDDEIMDADYTEPVARKRLRTSQILILGAVAVFAVGGVASIFVTPATAPQNPLVTTTPSPATVIEPEPSVKLPLGLAAPDPAQPTENIPGATANAPSTITSAAADPLVNTSATVALPPNLAATPSSLPVPANTGGVSPDPVAAAPAVPASAEPQRPPVLPTTTTSNPVAAQIAEAQKPSPVAHQVLPTTQSKAPTVPPQAQTTQKPSQQQATPVVPAAPKVATGPTTPTNADKRPTSAIRPTVQTQPRAVSADQEPSEEGIKRLVTTSAEAFGLQSIQEGAITLEGRRGNAPQRLRAGDRLPSGEQILRIDARSMTLVTDRSVIRLN